MACPSDGNGIKPTVRACPRRPRAIRYARCQQRDTHDARMPYTLSTTDSTAARVRYVRLITIACRKPPARRPAARSPSAACTSVPCGIACRHDACCQPCPGNAERAATGRFGTPRGSQRYQPPPISCHGATGRLTARHTACWHIARMSLRCW